MMEAVKKKDMIARTGTWDEKRHSGVIVPPSIGNTEGAVALPPVAANATHKSMETSNIA